MTVSPHVTNCLLRTFRHHSVVARPGPQWNCCTLCISSTCKDQAFLVQVCEGTDAVPPNARSHSALLSGVFIGDATSLVRLKFGIEASTREVAMHVTVRSDSLEVSELVHQIIQDA